MDSSLGERLEASLGELLQRRTRLGLYADLVAGVDRGLDISSYPLLSGLARTGPTTARRLGQELGLDRSGVSRYATRLEQGGLLYRTTDPTDARGTLLVLTDEGQRVVSLLRHRLAAMLDHQLAAWPSAEAENFVNGLQRFVHDLRSLEDPPPSDPAPEALRAPQ